jgi:hypothetical protein
MRLSYLPRWKFADSCGHPTPPPGILHFDCDHRPQERCRSALHRRDLFKAGFVVVGAAGAATLAGGVGTALAQGRNFPPPPITSPIAGLMDTHVHAAPDVFGRGFDDE